MHRRILTGLAIAPALALCAAASAQDTSPAKQNFEVINKSGFTVVAFTATPTNKNASVPNRLRQPNMLEKGALPNGETAKIIFQTRSDECLWDLKAIYEDDDVTELGSVDLCEVATVTLNP